MRTIKRKKLQADPPKKEVLPRGDQVQREERSADEIPINS